MMSILRPQCLGLVLALVSCMVSYSEACSCGRMEPQAEFCQSPYVFLARVDEELESFTPDWVKNPPYPGMMTTRRFRVTATTVLRATGTLLNEATIIVQDSPLCRYSLTVGHSYFLSAGTGKDKLDSTRDVVSVGLCSLNHDFDSTFNYWDRNTVLGLIESPPTCGTRSAGGYFK